MTVYIGARTDAGKRDNNEDCVAVIRNTDTSMNAEAILIVADGMGGRASGEHASASAVETIKETLESLLAVGEGVPPPYEDALATAMRRANSRVYEMSRAKAGQKGMGTTCVTAVIGDGSVSLAHVGDSRAYLLRDGILRRLTEDHSYIQDQVRSGNLSDHDARTSRFRHVITKAIGVEATVRPDFQSHPLQEGDVLLLCTDGLSGVVDEAGMIQIMSRTLNAQAASEYLVDAAKRQGSKDNITNIVARYGGEPEPEIPQVAAEPPVVTDSEVPESPKRAQSGIATLLVAAIVGALVGIGLMRLGGAIFKAHHAIPAAPTPSVQTPNTPVAVVPTNYLAPRVLVAKTVIGNVMAGSDAGVVVAEASDGALWSVSSIGQVTPAGKINPGTWSQEHDISQQFIAIDSTGRTYVSSPSDKDIRRYSPDGTLERTIDQGQLQNPTAIWVARNGDIYVIDDDRLNLIQAQVGAANPPTTAPAPGSSGAGATAATSHPVGSENSTAGHGAAGNQ